MRSTGPNGQVTMRRSYANSGWRYANCWRWWHMPKVELPTSVKGWFIALMASFVGFVSGFLTIKLMQSVIT